jgi:hypothetical protein
VLFGGGVLEEDFEESMGGVWTIGERIDFKNYRLQFHLENGFSLMKNLHFELVLVGMVSCIFFPCSLLL